MKYLKTNLTLLCIVVIISLSCSSSTETSTDFPDIEGFDATIGENTTTVPPHVSEAGLNSYDEENHVFRFDADVLADAGIELEEGGILLIEELALRRITSVSESNGEIEVETGFAALNEAFENLDLNVHQTIEFTPDILANATLEFNGNEFRPYKASVDTVKWEGSFGDFEVEAVMFPQHTEVFMSLLVRYAKGDASGAALTNVNIKGFQQQTAIQIAGHKTEEFSFNNVGLAGSVDMQFIFAGGLGDEQTIAPPQPVINIPFSVGPIPFRLRMGTLFVSQFNLGATGTAQMETSFTYDGDMGFQVKGTNFTPIASGGIQDPSASEAKGNAAGFGGQANGQYGVAIPDISLRIFGIPAVGYLRQEYYVGASYTFPTCTKINSRYLVNAGLDVANPTGLSILDFSTNYNLVEKTTHEYESDGCSGKMNPYDKIFIPHKGVLDIPQIPYKIEEG